MTFLTSKLLNRHDMEDAWFATEKDYGVFDGVSGAAKVSFGEVYRLSFALISIIHG